MSHYVNFVMLQELTSAVTLKKRVMGEWDFGTQKHFALIVVYAKNNSKPSIYMKSLQMC